MEKTKEVLVRTVTTACPDGKAVYRTEHIEVIIEWPNTRPKRVHGYGTDGHWVISEGVI